MNHADYYDEMIARQEQQVPVDEQCWAGDLTATGFHDSICRMRGSSPLGLCDRHQAELLGQT